MLSPNVYRPLAALIASLGLTACPTTPQHNVPRPEAGDSTAVESFPKSGVMVVSPRPLPSGMVVTSARPTPTLIQVIKSPSPKPEAAPTPEEPGEATPSASPSAVPSFTGLLPSAGPSPVGDPTARFFPSPGTR